MTQSPNVNFGMVLLGAALSAKQGRLRDLDVIVLLKRTLEFSAIDRRVSKPVLDFCDNYKSGAHSASDALQGFVTDWIREVAPEEVKQMSFEWQNRADFQ